ncbi:hypothetical protein ACFLZD_01660, partial [Candidatus Neomarinimicrobiota bacterium]
MLKTTIHNSIQFFIILVLFYGNIRSQEYDVSIWGIPVGRAEIQQNTDEEITLIIKSNEFIDYVFPI